MSNLRVKVVLVDVNGGEVVLGPFNQGVVLQHEGALVNAVDVANSKVVTSSMASFWIHEGRWFTHAFVQGLAPTEEIR